jgi:predicted protein tyrosine phosphatase
MKTKILFVCGQNVDRSPTAEEMYRDVEGFEVRSAGVSYGATIPVTRELVDWADRIFVMEEEHQRAILKIAPSSWKKIEVLGIPDRFCRDEPELKQLINEKMRPFIQTTRSPGKSSRS